MRLAALTVFVVAMVMVVQWGGGGAEAASRGYADPGRSAMCE